MSEPVLEPEAQAFADAVATPPFVDELGPERARKVLRYLHLAGGCVEFHLDIMHFAGLDTGFLAPVRAESEHEPATH